jgi:hypothetical protein
LRGKCGSRRFSHFRVTKSTAIAPMRPCGLFPLHKTAISQKNGMRHLHVCACVSLISSTIGAIHQITIRAPSQHDHTPSQHHQSTIRAPSEHHQSAIRAPSEHHQIHPSERHESAIRAPSDPPIREPPEHPIRAPSKRPRAHPNRSRHHSASFRPRPRTTPPTASTASQIRLQRQSRWVVAKLVSVSV